MKRIVLFGDSTLMGFRNGKPSDTLAKRIRKDFQGYEVINMSIADYKTNNAMTRVDRIKRLDPKVIILGFGVNDISIDDEIKPGKFAANLTNIIETLGSQKIILLSPPFTDWHKDSSRPWTRQLQFELVTEHLSKQLDVSYIDLLHKMANTNNLNELLQADGLHFTKQGYNLLEDELIPEIKATLANQNELVSN
ncbi:SGNH/GDSL hydrolase family protein [Companilactobacillus alimentarius]|uniref:SGNH/GDSL hydrolase family protein n=1 Tax=Companilactobacillus alimentarius TaxID=1602 RepID=UPI003D7C7DD3